MLTIIVWTLIFCLCTAGSITLLGSKSILNQLQFPEIFSLVLNWKFIVSMLLALGARVSFMYLNAALVKIPKLANSSTTATAFITATSFIFVILFNFYFLQEKISVIQGIGMLIILLGVVFVLS